jgi:SAM-dependent methyltransferase
VLTAPDRLHGVPGEFDVVRCRACGLMRTSPRPTPDTIGRYYPPEYGPHAPPATARFAGARRSIRRRIVALADRRSTRAPALPPGRLLEIGCGAGAYLRQMRDAGWDVTGLDASPEAGDLARAHGLEVIAGRLEEAPDPAEPFDLVVGWMALEHLHDPALALRRLHDWTRPGGRLALSTPDAGGLLFRTFGQDWYCLQVPTHLHHFTPGTLGRLLGQNGWAVERTFHHRTLDDVFTSTRMRLERTRPGWPFIRLLPAAGGRAHYLAFPAAMVAAAAGQTGRMTVWARRA